MGEGWKASEPGLQYVLHDDVLGQRYLNASWGPRFARAFGQLALGPIRSDFLRLAYIAEHGGFYADADVCPMGNATLAQLRDLGAPLVIVASQFNGELLNAFFGAVPRHPDLQPLVWAALHHIEAGGREYKNLGATAVAGPMLMGSLLHARPKVVLQENTTGTAYLPKAPELKLGSCAGLAKSWSSWWGVGVGWHRATPVQYEYAQRPVVEKKWSE